MPVACATVSRRRHAKIRSDLGVACDPFSAKLRGLRPAPGSPLRTMYTSAEGIGISGTVRSRTTAANASPGRPGACWSAGVRAAPRGRRPDRTFLPGGLAGNLDSAFPVSALLRGIRRYTQAPRPPGPQAPRPPGPQAPRPPGPQAPRPPGPAGLRKTGPAGPCTLGRLRCPHPRRTRPRPCPPTSICPWTRDGNTSGMSAGRRHLPRRTRAPAAGTAPGPWSPRPCRAGAGRPGAAGEGDPRRSSAPSASTWMQSPGGWAPMAARTPRATFREACSRARWGCPGWWSCSGVSASGPPGSSPAIPSRPFPINAAWWPTPVTRSACTATRTRTPSR